MNVYSYDPQTYEFVGELTADPSPLENGVYLIPAWATQIPPPSADEHQVAVFDIDAEIWSIQPDYRGAAVFSTVTGSRIEIRDIGPLPVDVTSDPRPSSTYIWQNGAWQLDVTISNEIANGNIKQQLQLIDLKTIRSLREWIAAQPNAPQFTVDHEQEAQTLRNQLIP